MGELVRAKERGQDTLLWLELIILDFDNLSLLVHDDKPVASSTKLSI